MEISLCSIVRQRTNSCCSITLTPAMREGVDDSRACQHSLLFEAHCGVIPVCDSLDCHLRMHLKVWRSSCADILRGIPLKPRADETNEREFAFGGSRSRWPLSCEAALYHFGGISQWPGISYTLLRTRGSLDISQPLSGPRYDSLPQGSVLCSTLWVSCGTHFSSPPSYSHKLVFQRTV